MIYTFTVMYICVCYGSAKFTILLLHRHHDNNDDDDDKSFNSPMLLMNWQRVGNPTLIELAHILHAFTTGGNLQHSFLSPFF